MSLLPTSCIPEGAGCVARRSVLTIATLTLAACAAVDPDYVVPTADVPDRLVGSEIASAAHTLQNDWWRNFNDSRLNAVVSRGLAQNLDIQTALVRVQTAEAQLGTTGVNAQFQGGLGLTSQRTGGDVLPAMTNDRATLSGTYVFDLFGGVRRGHEQILANLEATQFDASTVRLAFLSSVIGAYADARYYQEALALTRRTVRSRERTRDLVLEQRALGSAADLEVAQAQAQVDSALSMLPGLENGFNLSVFRIATLLAEPAGPLMTTLQRGSPQLYPRATGPIGVPANLLRNRPDVQAAERRYASAVATIGVAEAQLYPSLDLSGTVTAQSASTWGFGPTISIPILNQGVLRARRNVAVSTAQQAELAWRAAVLSAVEDVQAAASTAQRTVCSRWWSVMDDMRYVMRHAPTVGHATLVSVLA